MSKAISYVLSAIGVVALALAYLEPISGLTTEGNRAVGLTIFAATWWVAELIPGPLTSILIPVLAILYIGTDIPTAMGGFLVPAVWFFLGASMMMTAVTETGLGDRIGTRLSAGGRIKSIRSLVLMSFILGIVFGPILPSLVAKYMVAVPIYIGILKKLGVKARSKEAAWALMSLAIGIRSSALIVLNGDVLNIVTAGLLGVHRGLTVSWGEFLSAFGPPAAAATLLSLALLLLLSPKTKFPKPIQHSSVASTLGANEKRALIILGSGIIIWGLDFIHKIDPSWIAVLLGVVFFLPRVGVLGGKDLNKLDYGLFIYGGGAISLSFILLSSGVAVLFSDAIARIGGNLDTFTAFIVFSILTSLVHFGMTGVATASIVQPISMQFFSSVGANPILGAATAIVGNTWFIFPYQLIPTMIILRTGWVAMDDWIKITITWTIMSIAILPLLYYGWLTFIL